MRLNNQTQRRAADVGYKVEEVSAHAMQIPEFKPSRRFLDEIDLACLVAKVKNSMLPKVATRHIAKYKEDPVCEFWVRSSNPKELTGWPREILEELLEKEGLPAALEEGMRDYESNKAWPGYFKDDEQNYGEIKQHGIVPLLTLNSIVIDEVRRTIILGCHTEWDIHLSEHGIALCFQEGVWRFNLGDYFSDYIGEVDDEGRESRWEIARPLGEITSETVTDTTFIQGTWVFDPEESLALLKRLKESARGIKVALENYGKIRYQISPPLFVQTVGPQAIQRWEYVWIGCERRGEEVVIKYRRASKPDEVISEKFYYPNGLLMNLNGLVLRRKAVS